MGVIVAGQHQVSANGDVYTVVDDCTISYQAIITGALTDEVFGDFTEPEFTVTVSLPGLNPRAATNGLYVVAGYPEQAFPQLNSTSYPLTLGFTAPGFRPATLPVTVPMNATFPVPAGPLALRRLPVRIQGRVVTDTLPRTPVAGALVHSLDNPHAPSIHPTVLRSPLYFPHASAAPVQAAALTAAGNSTLASAAPAATQVLNLNGRASLAPGALVRLSSAAGVVVEYGVVDHLGPGAPAAGQVFLTNPLNRSYPTGTPADFFTTAPTGPSGALLTDADAGDGVLLANLLFSGVTLAVDAGAPTVEYHELGALTDSNGFYSLDGIGRVQDLVLQVNSSATAIVDWYLEYENAINLVDFRI